MNTPVKFELAKLLKEKGFRNFDCRIYHTETELRDFPKIPKFYPEARSREQIYEEVDIYFAPTIAEVIMWLYEKHKIWVYQYFVGIGYSCYIIQKVQKTNSDLPIIELVKDSINYDELFDSPTEAYEAAIDYVLTNKL